MKTKGLCMIITILLTINIFNGLIVVEAQEEIGGTCGENVFWKLDEEGVLTISGTGKMRDFADYWYVPWSSYFSDIISVNIEEGVTFVGSFSFWECTNLKSVTIAESVTSMGSHIFTYCSNLESVILPTNLSILNDWTFYGCSSLKNITLPNKLTYIGSCMFYGCSSLEAVIMPESVGYIGSSAFYGCSEIKGIVCEIYFFHNA